MLHFYLLVSPSTANASWKHDQQSTAAHHRVGQDLGQSGCMYRAYKHTQCMCIYTIPNLVEAKLSICKWVRE